MTMSFKDKQKYQTIDILIAFIMCDFLLRPIINNIFVREIDSLNAVHEHRVSQCIQCMNIVSPSVYSA